MFADGSPAPCTPTARPHMEDRLATAFGVIFGKKALDLAIQDGVPISQIELAVARARRLRLIASSYKQGTALQA